MATNAIKQAIAAAAKDGDEVARGRMADWFPAASTESVSRRVAMTHTPDLNRIELLREFWDEALKRLKARAEAAQRDSEHVINDPSTDKVLKGRNADLDSQSAVSIGTPNEKRNLRCPKTDQRTCSYQAFPSHRQY
ncbi:hypothetical protein FTW19_00135 [Terriglobus albidus]|uniref:Uncharacterized protein n=1 Tax=Terriglobus albidus TaxID=1592106 RepID=A0A5B9E4Q7_9BACT|nr:hypothetical protein [Terriglobus albidus]QEE26554.1 hypothetical protein FTW19_00135 [Terriglobus albidus]